MVTMKDHIQPSLCNISLSVGSTTELLLQHIIYGSTSWCTWLYPTPNVQVFKKYFTLYIVATLDFDQSVYSVDENNGVVQVTVVLSNPSSSDITVQVFTTDGSATGNLTLILFDLSLYF